MQIAVHFYSYFKELADCAETQIEIAQGGTLQNLIEKLCEAFPKWAPMENATLIAVGVEYQGRDYALKAGDEVSLFPPVQGG